MPRWCCDAGRSDTSGDLMGNFPELHSPFALFLLQLLLVLGCAKAAGALMRHVRQPAVIGEMLAGILLGPSLFGLLSPSLHAAIFPTDSLAGLSLVSQLGVLVFMFAAGAEFDLGSLKGQRRRALVISHAGIALPFLLGLLLAIGLHARYAPAGISYTSFALFLGMALSITAFPVLLRILEERGYRSQPIGQIAIACAAMGDATAWGMLGIIVAYIQSTGPAGTALSLALVLSLVWVCARWLRRSLAQREVREQDEPRWIRLLVLAALGGGLVTESIGLHALFGAFIAGIVVSGNARLRSLSSNASNRSPQSYCCHCSSPTRVCARALTCLAASNGCCAAQSSPWPASASWAEPCWPPGCRAWSARMPGAWAC